MENGRKIKKVVGRATNNNISESYIDGEVVPKRVTFEEEKITSSKKNKNEDQKAKRQKELNDFDNEIEVENEAEHLYEDEFDDEWEDEEPTKPVRMQEEYKQEAGDDEWDSDEENVVEEEMIKKFGDIKFSDEPVIYEKPVKTKGKKKGEEEPQVWMGTNKNLGEDEVLEFDNSAYDLFHRFNADWPCLSMDILIPEHNQQGIVKPAFTEITQYPLTCYVVAGTQASKASDNSILFMKWSELHKTRFDDDSQVFDAEDMEADEEAAFDILTIAHQRGINRIRAMNNSSIVALWDDHGAVSIYDGTKHTQALVDFDRNELANEEDPNQEKKLKAPKDPKKKNFLLSQFQHSSEGYALDWSPHTLGLFATGSCDRKIHLYSLADENGSAWVMDESPFFVHKESVEDLQFCPDKAHFLASCSVDGTVRFMDMRSDNRKQAEATVKVSDTDVNVISWSHAAPNLIATGADDGAVQIYDIRFMKKARSIADIRFHKEQITSIQFQPFEDSVVTVASGDNRISVWNFSVEPDVKTMNEEIPDQLMFIHQGIEDVKEIRHHPYMSELILSTAANGFNIFKPNYEEQEQEY